MLQAEREYLPTLPAFPPGGNADKGCALHKVRVIHASAKKTRHTNRITTAETVYPSNIAER